MTSGSHHQMHQLSLVRGDNVHAQLRLSTIQPKTPPLLIRLRVPIYDSVTAHYVFDQNFYIIHLVMIINCFMPH
ncbi:MAG: hypothetical protein ACI9EP_001065 [Oceanospirillaceae bacterium]|jgi:hypothetical protein